MTATDDSGDKPSDRVSNADHMLGQAVPLAAAWRHVLGHIDRSANLAGRAACYPPTFAEYSASVTGSIQVT